MSSTLRFSGLLPQVAAGAVALAAAAAPAADALPDRQCGGGVCMANVEAKQAIAPCLNANLVLAWAQAGGALAVECQADEAATNQPIYVFDRRDPTRPAYDLTGVRAFAPDALPQLAHVPGAGSDVLLPACRRPVPATMAPGELLLTEKVPSDNERHPYCYRVLRVASSQAGITIRADDGKPVKADAPSAEWHDLAARMSALVAQAEAGSRAHVTRQRAPLRDTPDPKAPPHGFLVKGDAVLVLERNAPAGLVKVLWVNPKGVAIERWVRREDITP